MSGIEVAGLVLAALPLFISAAEHYSDGLEKGRIFFNKRQFAEQYQSEVLLQQTLLSCYLKALVARTALKPAQQLRLIDSPLADDWRKPVVVVELQKELGIGYQPFVGLVERICRTFAAQIRHDDKSSRASTDEELASPNHSEFWASANLYQLNSLRDLCLDSAKASTSQQEDVWNRIKFTCKHGKREKILSDLKSHNASLRHLEDALTLAKPFERKQQSSRAHATFQLRQDTERLYQAISKACTCQPCQQRNVALGMAFHCYKPNDVANLSFQLLFFDAQDRMCATLVAFETPESPQKSSKKRVRLNIPSIKIPHTTGAQLQKIQDICALTNRAHLSKDRVHLVVDEAGELCTRPGAQSDKRNNEPLSSLYDLLQNLKIHELKRWIQPEKPILAVILAYSLLQLHESSWWQSAWSSSSISFLETGGQAQLIKSPDYRLKLRRPFTRSMLSNGGASPSPSPLSHKNEHLHAFGRVLLELHLCRSIQPEIDAHLQAGGKADDACVVLQRLLQNAADDITMTGQMSQAIRFCLFPNPNPRNRSFSFGDEGFREIFYTEVIANLEEHLGTMCEDVEQIWKSSHG